MTWNEPRKFLGKWAAFGTGIGIEIGATDLRVIAVRIRPNGVRLLGAATIGHYQKTPASEWGIDYAAFVKKIGLAHMAANVLLPRTDVIVRQITLPGVEDKDLDGAIRYQIDSLHPYPDDDTVFDWARVGDTPTIVIAIARKNVIERYSTLFAEAGVKIAAFTFSAAAAYSAIRIYGEPDAAGFVAIDDRDSEVEAYGESPAHPLFTATFETTPERAKNRALSELRLPPDSEAVPFFQLLPTPIALPEDFAISRTALPYATALASSSPWPALAPNLLPADKRGGNSRMMFVPTIALGVILLLLVGAVAGSSAIENRRYMKALQVEIGKVQRDAVRMGKLDQQIEATRNRTALLDGMRRRAKQDMDALNELTRLLPAPTWLGGLEISRNTVTLAGESDQAAGLLKVLDASPLFENSEFITPLQRVGTAESFRIKSAREGLPK